MRSAGSRWPDGRRAAVSVTFDNLGEAAELELGVRAEDEPLGGHYSVTTALPIVLEELSKTGLAATFFVEGLNAQVYPEALREIADAGHEVGYHAWRHEDWATLAPDEEDDNLRRGTEAMRALGLSPAGFRPPGGRLNDDTLALLRRHGFSHCSPAGSRSGVDEIVVLPFGWPAVDAFHVLPAFAALRRHFTGSEEAGGAETVRKSLLGAIDEAVAQAGHAVLVLHTALIELELSAVRELLARARAGVAAGELWVARCDEVAAWISSHPGDFPDAPALDQVSWAEPSAAAPARPGSSPIRPGP